jgi:hypothetical protein
MSVAVLDGHLPALRTRFPRRPVSDSPNQRTRTGGATARRRGASSEEVRLVAATCQRASVARSSCFACLGELPCHMINRADRLGLTLDLLGGRGLSDDRL